MGKKVLVVDDEIHIIRILNYKLTSAGYEVLQARDGNEALEVASRDKPDLIFLDIMMPGISGFEVLESLKQDPATRDIPVVILSAKGQDSDRSRGLGLGVVDYIVKPFSPSLILQKTQDLIG